MIANAYARTYRVNSVVTASPGQLVLMLFDGALKALALAQAGFEMPEGDLARFEKVNTHLLKAQSIFTELRSGLNMAAGGEFATTMDRLYDYYNRRLFEANLRKEVAPVIEVERLLRDVRDAWAQMLGKQEGGVVLERGRNLGQA
ncbi:MAG: hypothetical protein RL077_5739 [Verrucomicrobiota bacterium]|jgi:flagellar protein FliS